MVFSIRGKKYDEFNKKIPYTETKEEFLKEEGV